MLSQCGSSFRRDKSSERGSRRPQSRPKGPDYAGGAPLVRAAIRTTAATTRAAPRTPSASSASPDRTLPAATNTTPATTIAATAEPRRARSERSATFRSGVACARRIVQNASSATRTSPPATNNARASTAALRKRRNNAYSAPNPTNAHAITNPHPPTSANSKRSHAAAAIPPTTSGNLCVAVAGYATSAAKSASVSAAVATRRRFSRSAGMSSPPRGPAPEDVRRPSSRPARLRPRSARATRRA